VVDSSLYESVLQVMESLIRNTRSPARFASARRDPAGIAPSNVYPCLDGEFLIAPTRTRCSAPVRGHGQPELASNPRYVDHTSRGVNQVELDTLIGEWTKTLTIEQLDALMTSSAFRRPDLPRPRHAERPALRRREAIIELEHPAGRT